MTREAQEAADELSKEGALVGQGPDEKVEPPHDCRLPKKIHFARNRRVARPTNQGCSGPQTLISLLEIQRRNIA